MKTVYFYGCSFTAGDELSDFEYPELCNHPNAEIYTVARRKFLATGGDKIRTYFQKNRSRSYPAKVSAAGFNCENFAENGASLEDMICKIILHVSEKKKPDIVFLQIPPLYREALFYNEWPFIDTLMLNNLGVNVNAANYSDYMKSKIMSFDGSHFAIGDLMKLYMLKYFLDQQNIKLYLIEMVNDLKLRYSLATNEKYKNIIDTIKQIPLFDVDPIVKATPSPYCTAGHFNEKIHSIMADRIVALIG